MNEYQYSFLGRTAVSIRFNTTFRGLAPSPSSGKKMQYNCVTLISIPQGLIFQIQIKWDVRFWQQCSFWDTTMCALGDDHHSRETYWLNLLGTHPDNLQCSQLNAGITVIEFTNVIQITFLLNLLHYLKCTVLPHYCVPPKSGHYKV
jgi:hypothetical protein